MRVGDEAFMGALRCSDGAPDLCKPKEEELIAREPQGGQCLLSSVFLYPVLVRLGGEKTRG